MPIALTSGQHLLDILAAMHTVQHHQLLPAAPGEAQACIPDAEPSPSDTRAEPGQEAMASDEASSLAAQ